ncbi:MAG TPA: hypothetical protein VGU20_21645, partial [Stellaceae bacterium]|nr:hypothetical protein [Stellaceae bacterium]
QRFLANSITSPFALVRTNQQLRHSSRATKRERKRPRRAAARATAALGRGAHEEGGGFFNALKRATAALGKRLRFDLVDAA